MKKKLIALAISVAFTGVVGVNAFSFNEIEGSVDANFKAEAEYNENSKPAVLNYGVEDSQSNEEAKNEEKEEIKEEEPKIEEVAEEVVEEVTEPVQPVDVNVYNSNPSSGFTVTTGNQTYSLSVGDVDLLTAITAAECDKSYDDALAVISVILNRCEDGAWVRSHGTNPVSQATAPNQFVVYQEGYYRNYLGGNAPETVRRAVQDALNGTRNNNFLSFRSNNVTSYSNNMITPTGNRYR